MDVSDLSREVKRSFEAIERGRTVLGDLNMYVRHLENTAQLWERFHPYYESPRYPDRCYYCPTLPARPKDEHVAFVGEPQEEERGEA